MLENRRMVVTGATVHFSVGEEELFHLPEVGNVIRCSGSTDPASAGEGMAQNAAGTGFLRQRCPALAFTV